MRMETGGRRERERETKRETGKRDKQVYEAR